MLLQMRTFTRSWISYVLLFVLTAAFAIWGVHDVFRGVGSQNLAEVGSLSITPAQLNRELELTLRRERNQNEGTNLSKEEAIDQGIHTRLLEGMIGRLSLLAFAHNIGVSASDAQVAARIRDIPAVVNPVTGAFDENQYDQFLNQIGYTRPEFEQDMRGDLTRAMLMEALVAGVRAPSSFGAMALTYETETRVVSIAEAPGSIVGRVAPPTDAQLQSFYEENQERLRVPEFRALTLVYARPSDFAARVDVPEQRLREEFETRRASLTQPERRTYIRISAQTEAQATQAATRLARGESATAIAASMHLQAARGENETATDIPDARVAEAVFAMAPGSAPRAIRGQLSPWAMVAVQSVTPAVEPSFAEQREQIRQVIAADEAGELLNSAISAFEEARASGTSVAEAARANQLPTIVIPAIELEGRDRAGEPVAALAGQEDLLATAFQTGEGEASDFMPIGENGDVLIAVDGITPSSVRPLAEVREQLSALWMAREGARRLREVGEQVIAAVHGGQTFAAAARAHHLNVLVASRPIDRRMAGQIPSRGLAGQIFAGAEGAVVADMRQDGGALLVASVERINRVDPATQPQVVEANRVQMTQTLAESFAAALQDQIIAQAHPRRNEELLHAQFRGSNAAAEENQ